MTMTIDPKTPEGRHAIALDDFCYHLTGAREHARKAIDKAQDAIGRLEAILAKIPAFSPPAEMSPADEAALLRAVEAGLPQRETARLQDDADDDLKVAGKACDEVIGRLNEVWSMRPYLAAGDFTDAENDA